VRKTWIGRARAFVGNLATQRFWAELTNAWAAVKAFGNDPKIVGAVSWVAAVFARSE